jgi:hypothetical protein
MITTTSLGLAAILAVLAQTPTAAPPPAPTPAWKLNVVNMTRVESWQFFEPPPSGGDPSYAFVANRFRASLTGTWKPFDFSAAIQYVQFGGLPTGAAGPGALGTGALYYQHSGETTSRGLYSRTLNVRVRLPHSVTLQAGRVAYVSGAEAASGRPKIEAVKRARVDSRLIGEFEWSLYQRSFDGVRADVDQKRWHATGAWLRPTQGGFEEEAGKSLGEVDLVTGVLALRPGVVLAGTDLTLFAYRYDDDRRVAARPDNSGLAAPRVDVGITTFGVSAVGAAPRGSGEVDYLAWLAAQTGDCYGQAHRAWSLAAEAGYQWKKARWQPWVRAGYLHASGDDNPSDGRHGTFFPMVPTVRKYSMTTVYSTMNLDDLFAEVIVKPATRFTARLDVRRLWLAEAADRWYAGSGATQRTGTFFGYAGRRSGDSTDLAPLVMQGAADVTIARHWTANAFVGAIRGGDVVAASFQGRWLRFVYLEQVLQW